MKYAAIFHANLRHAAAVPGARIVFEASGFTIDVLAELRRMNRRREITDFTSPL